MAGRRQIIAEALEPRRLMSTGVLSLVNTSGTFNVVPYGTNDLTLVEGPFSVTSKGTLLIKGTDNADRITIYAKGTGSAVIFQNRNSPSLTSEFRFTRSEVKRIRVDGGARNDILAVIGDLDVPITLLGGSGNDAIYGSSTSAETIFGNDGDDHIEAARPTAATFSSSSGATTGKWVIVSEDVEGSEVHGNLGNDTIMPSDGPDTLFGDGGQDTLLVPNVTAINLSDPSPGDTLTSIELFEPHRPSLRVQSGSDRLVRFGDAIKVVTDQDAG